MTYFDIICHMSAMTYDTINICQYGCLWNLHYLSNAGPGFIVAKKFINMPKKWKTKKLKFPLDFLDFSLYISGYLRRVKEKSDSAENWGIYSWHVIEWHPQRKKMKSYNSCILNNPNLTLLRIWHIAPLDCYL